MNRALLTAFFWTLASSVLFFSLFSTTAMAQTPIAPSPSASNGVGPAAAIAPPPEVAPSPAPGDGPVRIGRVEDLNSGDTAWMLVSAALVLMMTGPGLALFYGGLVQRKNVLSTMMHCFVLMALVSVAWAIVGYSLAFDVGSPWIGGFRFAFLREVGNAPSEYARTIPHSTWMVYQMMFAVITPALICGAYAERMKFSSMIVFSLVWLLAVYCPMAHMVWGKGGMFNAWMGGSIPTMDFAGGTVVHINSGVSALVCALMLGRRRGYGRTPMPPHSVVLSVIGAAMLWVGWFGFNAGSALTAGGLASTAFVNTHLAASAGALAWAAVEWIKNGKPTVLGAISGAVAGLVAITPASGYTLPMYALIIGVAAGLFCWFSATEIKQLFGYDDTLDAFGVHGTGGTLGALLTGVFAVCTVNCPPGLDIAGKLGLVEGNWHPLVNQLRAVALTWLLSAAASAAILSLLKVTIGLRVSEADEFDGLDLSQHGEAGYNMEDALTTPIEEEA
jgi:Amt family ammonium transporter